MYLWHFDPLKKEVLVYARSPLFSFPSSEDDGRTYDGAEVAKPKCRDRFRSRQPRGLLRYAWCRHHSLNFSLAI